jgi:hypothetical protein
VEKVLYVLNGACNKVIHCNYMIAFFNKPVREVGTKKTGTPGSQYAFFFHELLLLNLW